MAAGYLVIKVPIKSLVQQSDGRLLAYRTRWSAWYALPHSFPHICAGNYSLDVKHPQMSHLKRGYMSPAHFEGSHLPPFSSFSFSTLDTRMSNRLATGQPRAWGHISLGDKEWKAGNRDLNECGCHRRRRAEGRETPHPSPPPSPALTHSLTAHLSASVVHTSFQTQTYTPVMECKYLNMGTVGCFFLPSKMCCLVENGPKKTTQKSLYFDFSKLTESRAALSIYQSPLRVSE